MRPSAIVDASCLIILDKIGCLHLLPGLFGPIFVTHAVQREAGITPDFVTVIQNGEEGQTPDGMLHLDAGEASVIYAALAIQPPPIVIIYEAKGRASARQLGLPLMGTVGILLAA